MNILLTQYTAELYKDMTDPAIQESGGKNKVFIQVSPRGTLFDVVLCCWNLSDPDESISY